MTSASSSKTDSICILYCVFDIGGFTILSLHHWHHLSWFLFGPYPFEDFELVSISMTSSSSSKTDSICILYCVFDIGGVTDLTFLDRLNLWSFCSILTCWTMMFLCILLLGSSLRFQRAQEHRNRSSDSKDIEVFVSGIFGVRWGGSTA